MHLYFGIIFWFRHESTITDYNATKLDIYFQIDTEATI